MNNFVVVFDELKKILDAVTRVANPKAVTKLVLGVSEVGEDVSCALKVLGGNEEVAVKFLAKKPKDFGGQPSQASVENEALKTILLSLSSIKESVTIGVGDALMLGIPNKAMTSLALVSEEDVPASVALNKDAQITRFYVKQTDALSLLRGGGFATADSDEGGRGVSNATLVVTDEKLVLYSCNETGSMLGYSECPVTLSDIATETGNKRTDFCKEKGIDNLFIPIPKKVLTNLIGFLDGEGQCSFIITDKVLLVAPNDCTQYLAVIGAKAFTGGLKLIAAVDQMPVKGAVVVDNEKFKTNLSMIRSFASIVSKKPYPISLKFGKDKLMISQTNGDGKVIVDLVASSFENADERLLDAEALTNVISILSKGNVKVEVRDAENAPLQFTNGSLSETSGTTKTYLSPVMNQAKEETTTATEE